VPRRWRPGVVTALASVPLSDVAGACREVGRADPNTTTEVHVTRDEDNEAFGAAGPPAVDARSGFDRQEPEDAAAGEGTDGDERGTPRPTVIPQEPLADRSDAVGVSWRRRDRQGG
jgi:hypothetical protein